MKTSTEKIYICECCLGKGIVKNERLIDGHKGEYEYWDTVCQNCKGSGRMKKTVTTVTEIVPYKNYGITLSKLEE